MYNSGIRLDGTLIEELSDKERRKWLNEGETDRETLYMIIDKLSEALFNYQEQEREEYEMIKEKMENEE